MIEKRRLPPAENRPARYSGTGSHEHNFSDHQFCLKCGKWEGAPEADDCEISHEQYEELMRKNREA